MVTRAVALPADAPAGAVVLRIPGLTALAEPGSLRAEVGGGREVVSLRTRLVLPAAPAAPGPAIERLRGLELARQALEADRTHLEWRRTALAQRELRSGFDTRDRFLDPGSRAADTLAVSGLFETLAAEVDRRLAELADALATNEREREAAELEAAQARSQDRAGAGHPSLEVLLGLSAGAAVRELSIVYAVRAARWWPTGAVRLAASGARAEWSLGAIVAQASGEDWTGVRLGLSTADLVHDARLPVLPSLRIGRVQAPPRTGYRAAPTDLDALFEGWDRATIDLGLSSLPGPADMRDDTVTRTRVPAGLAQELLEHEPEEVTPVFTMVTAAPAARPAPSAPPAKAAPPQDLPAPPASFAPQSLSARAHAAGPARLSPPVAAAAAVDLGTSIEPADSWLEFDALQLSAPEDRSLRGRLVRRGPVSGSGDRDAATAAIDALPSPGLARDPLETRGLFDARWDAEGLADVPSDARPHRVSVTRAEGPGRTRLHTVPREAAEVYREAWLDNPFDFPLLAAPVEVFVEGALVTTSPMAAVDRGGVVRLGLGVEERVRVARHVAIEEGAAGLLGGSTAVDHKVTIELRSSLGHAVPVEVVDRAPVPGEPDVDVTVTTQPLASPYDQSDRGRPVRGAMRWIVELPASGEARLELRYRVKLPASSEVVGGNRRD